MPTAGTKPAPLNGWLRCDFGYTLDADRPALCTSWFAYDATEAEAADDTDLATIEALIRDDWLTYFSPHLSTELQLSSLRLTLTRASGEVSVRFTTAAAGALTGDFTTAQVAAVVNWDIHARYRGGKPKMFLPGIAASAVQTDRLLQTSFSSDLEDDMNAWIGNMDTYVSSALTVPPAFIAPSWATGGSYRATAVQHQIFRGWVQRRVCTQRKRLGNTLT
jgi:hypothetical protein